ncbi:hypothetical protein [Streptococcus merionis]
MSNKDMQQDESGTKVIPDSLIFLISLQDAVVESKTCWLCQLSLTPAQVIRRFSANEPLLSGL